MLESYIIKINELTYVKDLIKNRLLLVDSIQSVTSIPSEKEERTLYVLNNVIYYYSNFEIAQVELEKQKLIKEKNNNKDIQKSPEKLSNK